MNSLAQLKKELAVLSSAKKAQASAWFFKTGKGQYGYGDVFIGVTVPEQRKVANRYLNLSLKDIKSLLNSKIHEYRLIALIILVAQFEKGNAETQKIIFTFYLNNSSSINNWDLVDASAPNIVGQYLMTRPKTILYKLVKSENIWERRIAIVSTYAFIRQNKFSDTLKISKLLFKDHHDLIHKATGWMLREVGKRSEPVLKSFINVNFNKMPRTALRYSIERLSKKDRTKYMS